MTKSLACILVLACACGSPDSNRAATSQSPPPSSPKAKPPPAEPFVPTALLSLQTGSQSSPPRVQVEALLLPHSIIRTSENEGKPRYFMLAVEEQSDYAKALAELERDAATFGADLAALLKKKRGKLPPKTLREQLSRFTSLADRLKALEPNPQQAIPVELHPDGLERLAITWNQIVKECEGPGCGPRPHAGELSLGSLLGQQRPAPHELFGNLAPPPYFNRCEEPFATAEQLSCLSDSASTLDRLSAQEPPMLEEEMPKLPKLHQFTEERVIRRYNALVRRFNAELSRRRLAMAQLLPSNVGRLERAAASLRGRKVTLQGVVMPLPELAAKAFRKSLGTVRTTGLRELAEAQPSFVSTLQDKARYCITSQPPDAEVTLKGQSVGRTPLCVQDVPFSELFVLGVRRDKYQPASLGPRRMEPSIDGSVEIHCLLLKSDDSSGSCKVL